MRSLDVGRPHSCPKPERRIVRQSDGISFILEVPERSVTDIITLIELSHIEERG